VSFPKRDALNQSRPAGRFPRCFDQNGGSHRSPRLRGHRGNVSTLQVFDLDAPAESIHQIDDAGWLALRSSEKLFIDAFGNLAWDSQKSLMLFTRSSKSSNPTGFVR
jgi:hypothetical protein